MRSGRRVSIRQVHLSGHGRLRGLTAIAAVAAVAALLGGGVGGANRSGASAAELHPVLGPPVARARPAASAPTYAAKGASPWEALVHAAPFSPGTMLLSSDGTVLVHAEPSSEGPGRGGS